MSATGDSLVPATHRDLLLGQVLAARRRSIGLTQLAVATAVGVSQPVWSRVERGEVELTQPRLRRAATILGLSPSEVLNLEERVVDGVRRHGVAVRERAPAEPLSAGAIFVGVAAVAALVLLILADD